MAEKTAEQIKAEKKAAKARVASKYSEIRAAESVLLEVEKGAAAEIGAFVKAYGPGPHKFKEGDSSYFLSFRKSGDIFSVKRAEVSAEDDD